MCLINKRIIQGIDMKFSDTDKMPNHTYESTRREPGKNHITGDAYRNILEFIRRLDKDENRERNNRSNA